MKKILPFIFCFFVFFNFIKPHSLQTASTYEFFSHHYELLYKVRIRCLNRPGYLSSLLPDDFSEDNRTKCEKLANGKSGTIWEIYKEFGNNSYVLQNHSDYRWLGSSIFPVPLLILEKNSDGSFKIKNYYIERYLVIDQDGYISATDDKNVASDFVLEPITISTDEYDDLAFDFDPNFNFCNIA